MELDLRTLTRLLLKLVGLYLLIAIAVSAPTLLAYEGPVKRISMIYSAAWMLAGIILVWFPGVIENGVLRLRGKDMSPGLDSREVLGVGIVLLGLFFVVSALQSLAFIGVNWIEAGGLDGAADRAHFAEKAVQLALGAICLLRKDLILRLTCI